MIQAGLSYDRAGIGSAGDIVGPNIARIAAGVNPKNTFLVREYIMDRLTGKTLQQWHPELTDRTVLM